MNGNPSEVLAVEQLSAELIDEWHDLNRSLGLSFFTSPTWALNWYHQFAAPETASDPAVETAIGIWRDGGELRGVAAMVRLPELVGSWSRDASVKVWRNLGSGAASGDHLGFVCDSELMEATYRWAQGLGGTVRLNNLAARWNPYLRGERLEADATFRTPLGDPLPGSKKLWSHIRRCRRRLVEDGATIDVRVGSQIRPDDLEQLLALHARRSHDAGRTTLFTEAQRPFFEGLARDARPGAGPVVVRIDHGDKVIGALIGFADSETFAYYQSGWDSEYASLSIGSLLVATAIEYAASESLKTFDFLRGDEPYKLRFDARQVDNYSITAYRGAGGRVLRLRDDARARRRRSS